MPQYNVDLSDLQLALLDQNPVERLIQFPRWQHIDRNIIDEITRAAYELAKTTMAPANSLGDSEGAQFDPTTSTVRLPRGHHKIYEQYVNDGWLGLTHGSTWTGLDLPRSLHMAVAEIFFGACMSFNLWPPLVSGVGHLIESLGTDAQQRTFLPRLYSGEWSGSMCLTEAGAGSDLGAIRTQAVCAGEHYLVSGEKTFITFGEHDLTTQICHVVLARIKGAPSDVDGLSLFIVPKYCCTASGALTQRNDVRCTRIERKMGIHAAPTCTLLFGENGACRGWLLGKPGQGLPAIFGMINEIRLLVGAQSTALSNAAYQHALEFAHTRVQGRANDERRGTQAPQVPIIRHPDVRRMLMWQKAVAEGTRAMVIRTAYLSDLAVVHDSPEEAQRHHELFELMIPLCKAYASEMACRSINLSIQTLGGYGYLSDYVVEQLARDVRVACIYEGTNGIQALDLLKRKLDHRGGLALATLGSMIVSTVERCADVPPVAAEGQQLRCAWLSCERAAAHLLATRQVTPQLAALHATPFLELLGDVVVGWLLLEQACLTSHSLSPSPPSSGLRNHFHDDKVHTARFWARQVLALVPHRVETLVSNDASPLVMSWS